MFWKPAAVPRNDAIHKTYRPETGLLLHNGGSDRLRADPPMKGRRERRDKCEPSPQLELGLEVDGQD